MTNHTDIVNAINNAFPALLRNNRKEDNAEFVLRVVQAMPPAEKWGLLSKSNGENGYTWPSGIRTSHDAIALPSGERVDIIGGSDSPGHPASPTWQALEPQFWRPSNVWVDVSAWTKLAGGSVPPVVIPPVVVPPPPIRLPDRGEAMAFAQWLDKFYMAPEGLQRPQGLSKDGRPDWEGVAAWMFGVWLQARVNGASEADAKAQVVREIQQSAEWRSKHP